MINTFIFILLTQKFFTEIKSDVTSDPSSHVEVFRDKTLREPMDRARERTRSVVDEILDRHILLAKLDDVTISRHSGVKLLEKNRIDPNVVIDLKKKGQTQKKDKFKNSRSVFVMFVLLCLEVFVYILTKMFCVDLPFFIFISDCFKQEFSKLVFTIASVLH